METLNVKSLPGALQSSHSRIHRYFKESHYSKSSIFIVPLITYTYTSHTRQPFLHIEKRFNTPVAKVNKLDTVLKELKHAFIILLNSRTQNTEKPACGTQVENEGNQTD